MDITNITTLANDAKRNYGKLPVIDYFDVDIVGVTGKCGERHVTGYAIKVQCHGDGRVRLATDVAAEYGMKLPKNTFRTKEEAYSFAMDYKAKWGKAKSKNGKAKEEAVAAAKGEVISKMRIALKAMGLSDTVIETIVATAV